MSLTGVAVAQAGEADPESPWLGLRSFAEETQGYFFGRGAELQEFLERVLHKPLTVLFGQSGLGKTSLIQAGLIPKLRDAALLPVRIRLRYEHDAGTPGRQMLEGLRQELERGGQTDLSKSAAEASDLWLLLHDPRFGFINEEGAPVLRPVFIFDQFEEIFTLGEQRGEMANDFRETLAAIVENRMPDEIRRLIENDDRLAERVDYHAHPAKVLLSLREDYLHLLERWRRRLPALMDNRMELRPLSGAQAVQAVLEPGSLRPGKPPIVSPETAEIIVRFVASAGPDGRLDEIDAVPPLLSLMCAELNAQRLAAGEETIAAEQLEGRSGHILEKFYSDTFANQPAAVREFVEDRLLSESGHRQAVTLDTAEAELARAGLAREAASQAIADLVERRLLVADERGGVRRVELTHDVLTAVASASRSNRRERVASAQLAAKQRERFRRQRRIALVVVTALLLGCAGLVAYAYRTRQEVRYRDLVDAGNFLLEAGDYPPSHDKFKEAAELRPSRAEAWFGMGDSLVRQAYGAGDARNTPLLLEAVNAYTKAVEIEKRNNAASAQHQMGLARLAQAYVGLGDVHALGMDPDFPKARALYKQAETTDPGSPDPHVGYGNIHLEEGEFHRAVEQYSAALKAARQRNSPNYGAHVGLGGAYFNLGHYAWAVEEFNRAIGANPGAVIARFRLAGAIYMANPADQRASELFRNLLGSNMKRLDSLTEMNLAYMRLEKPNPAPEALSEAIKELEDAYTKDPYAFSAFRLGIGRALQGNPAEATKLWAEASTLAWGSDSLSRRVYVPLLAALRDNPNAASQFQQVIESLAQEGATGFLANVNRDAELIRRSGLFAKQIDPLIVSLDAAITKAHDHNSLPKNDADALSAQSAP
jgi:tetratricopeptide (TPR) repeat protein